MRVAGVLRRGSALLQPSTAQQSAEAPKLPATSRADRRRTDQAEDATVNPTHNAYWMIMCALIESRGVWPSRRGMDSPIALRPISDSRERLARKRVVSRDQRGDAYGCGAINGGGVSTV